MKLLANAYGIIVILAYCENKKELLAMRIDHLTYKL